MVTIDLIIEDEVRTLWKNGWVDWHKRHKNALVADVFPKYDSFDEFMDDYISKTRAIIEEVVAKNDLNGEFAAEFTVKNYHNISDYAANFCLAQYHSAESTDSRAVFDINFYYLFTSIFQLFGRTDAEFRDTIQHELRHYMDRKFLKYSHETRKGKRKFNARKNENGELVSASINLGNYFITYLFNTRTEGFAAFDRSFAKFNRGDFSEEQFTASPEQFFRQSLARHTDTLTQVLNFCNNQKTMVYNKFVGNVGIIEEAPGSKCPGSELNTEEIFSPYAQGPLLFKVIALAEMKKRAKQTQRVVRLGDLLRENKIPEDIHKSVSKKVLGLKTLGEFFNLFYDSARELRLKPGELVVPKVYIDRYAAGK